jgi:hypothetical protein
MEFIKRGHNIGFITAVALGVAACSDTFGLDESRRAVGIFQMDVATTQSNGQTDPAIRWTVPPTSGITFPPHVIEAPDTVFAGQSFEITVHTIGPSGCWAADGVDAALSSAVIQLTPWDRHSGADVCTTILSYLVHTTALTLPLPGEWTIRASGRRVRGGNDRDTSVTAERTIHVRPAS